MEKVKIGGEEIVVGHQIRAKVVKNKCAAPFRKAEFMIYYDGRKIDKVQELTDIAIMKGFIPRFKADGTPDPKGRTFKWVSEPAFLAKSREEVYEQMKLFPKVQEEILDMIKNGVEVDNTIPMDDVDNMSEEEFEESLNNTLEAEETENNWENV